MIGISVYIALFLFFSSCMRTIDRSPKTGISHTPEHTVIQGYPDGFLGCDCVFSKIQEDYAAKGFTYFKKYGLVEETQNFQIISSDGEISKWYQDDSPEDFIVEVRYEEEDGDGRITVGKLQLGTLNKQFRGGTPITTLQLLEFGDANKN